MSDTQISDEDGATFDVLLTSAGSTRIAVYKAVHDTQMIGMKQARARGCGSYHGGGGPRRQPSS
jgi:ribosomal protein L7/L12